MMEIVDFCADADDFRPTQSTLLTRFTTISNCSEMWRTSNQDYGSFYYRSSSGTCLTDRLKSKFQRRQQRFQNWMNSQRKCPKNCSLFDSTNAKKETIRVTHRRQLSTQVEPNVFSLSPCGEDGLV